MRHRRVPDDEAVRAILPQVQCPVTTYGLGEDAQVRAVDVKAVKPVPKPVTLAAIKAEPRLKEMALAKYPRLSVQPVTAQEWKIVCALGGVKD